MKIIKFTGDEPITYIIQKLPGADQILAAYGLGCIACPRSEFESLNAGLTVHGFTEEEQDRVLDDLNTAAQELMIEDPCPSREETCSCRPKK